MVALQAAGQAAALPLWRSSLSVRRWCLPPAAWPPSIWTGALAAGRALCVAPVTAGCSSPTQQASPPTFAAAASLQGAPAALWTPAAVATAASAATTAAAGSGEEGNRRRWVEGGAGVVRGAQTMHPVQCGPRTVLEIRPAARDTCPALLLLATADTQSHPLTNPSAATHMCSLCEPLCSAVAAPAAPAAVAPGERCCHRPAGRRQVPLHWPSSAAWQRWPAGGWACSGCCLHSRVCVGARSRRRRLTDAVCAAVG